MSFKIVFLLAFLTVVFGLPSPPKKQPVGISKETLQGLPLSTLKKPLNNKPNKNVHLLRKPANNPSERLNDEISNEALRGVPLSTLKKPLVNTPKRNQKILSKQVNDPSEGLNDEISNEAVRGIPLSVLKKPLFTIAKKNQPNLGKQRNDASEELNDEINQVDYDEIDEETNNEEILVESVPSRMKRATCRNVTFRTKSGKTLTVYRCTK
ncbi:uncharacterized protein LOC129947865 [Eupeodes corollae]|uniref:uncharacterized protein LOC129947865 n=1 Tax=Eupeodes corollae TaxID=290404 RepID=UPI00249223E7|nr:uncharacterized protein LOC129947865 [Eupeodes corollae]